MDERGNKSLLELLGIQNNVQCHLADQAAYINQQVVRQGFNPAIENLDTMGELNLRLSELKTIRRLLDLCTIKMSKQEILHVLESTCSNTEDCVKCPYKDRLGECNRNERIADILLDRLGRYT